MMLMDNLVFGYTKFEIKDKILFAGNSNADTNKIKRFIEFGSNNNNFNGGSTTSNAVQTVCVNIVTQTTTVSNNHCPYPLNQCPNVYNGTTGPCDNCNVCADHTTTYSSYYDCYTWDDGGTNGPSWPEFPPSGGGGTGGGSTSPCSPVPAIVESVVPVNCPVIPNPWPPVPTLTQQLNFILQPGDSYTFQSMNPNNVLNVTTVIQFQNYLNNLDQNTSFSFDPPIVNQQGDTIVRAHINRTFIAGENIYVKIHKNAQNTYEVVDVTSSEWGASLMWSWSQVSYAPSYTSTDIIVDVYGYENYNLILEGFGTLYKKQMHFRITINKTTGQMTAIAKL